LEGAKIRSRIRWRALGEKPTKFFFSLEKKKAEDRTIHTLKSPDNTLLRDKDDILNTVKSYYSDLYTPSTNPTRDAAQGEILNFLDSYIPELKLPDLENDNTLEELSEAVHHSADGKSPGPDGLPVEFYKSFWKNIHQILLPTLHDALRLGSLPKSMQTGVISLLFKKGDRQLLKNWRPISLLNADFKMIGKVLAARLQKVLPELLGPEQTAIQKRWIMDSVHTVQVIYEAAKQDPEIKGGILYLDQESL